MSDSATPWTVAHQAPLSMEFSWQEHWSGLPFPSLEDLPNPAIKPGSPALQAYSLTSEAPAKPKLEQFQQHDIVDLKYNLKNEANMYESIVIQILKKQKRERRKIFLIEEF